MRLQRQIRRLLVIVVATGAMLATLAVPAAHAGEAARNCEKYYAEGNTSSPWNFTVCVKLVHGAASHTWWATASVKSSTPGIKLYLDALWMYNHTTNTNLEMNLSTRHGSGTNFVTAITYKNSCSGSNTFEAFALGHARWPNNVQSGNGTVSTSPRLYTGSC